MTEVSIYDYSDYKGFLEDKLPVRGELRGKRGALAKFVNCRGSHITQIIKGDTLPSLEVSEKITRYLSLSEKEKHFFILLVNHHRSGTEELKAYYKKQIEDVLSRRKELKDYLDIEDELSRDQAKTYYSSWKYAAIHISCSLPHLNSSLEISKALSINEEEVIQILSFLEDINIIFLQKGAFQTTGRRIHISPDDDLISKHHINWRLKSIENINKNEKDNIQFSAINSINKKDFKKIKNILLKSIKLTDEVVTKSEQDSLVVINIDLFKLP